MVHQASDEENRIVIETLDQPSEPATKRHWLLGGRNLVIGIVVGAVLTSVGTRLLSSGQENTTSPVAAPQTTAQSVTVAKVKTATVAQSVEATGTVAAFELIPVLSQATGLQIQQVFVQEGEFVEAGQRLARLDSAVLQAQLAQAKASVTEAQARLSELEAGSRSEEIAQAQETVRSATAGVVQAQSALDLASKRVQRNRALEAEGAIARDRLDEVLNEARGQESALQQAQASLREAQARLAQLQSGPRPEAIAQAKAQLAQAQAQERLVTAQLKDTQVVAPVSGKIATRDARVGNVTSSSDPLFEIIENGRLELKLKVPETQLAQIQPGQRVEITSDTDSQVQLDGTVRDIDPVVDPETRQATVEVDIPAQFKPGMFLRASIITSADSSLVVPADAVVSQPDGSAIAYVLQADDTVVAQPVETGTILSGQIEITSGLNPGDRVVVKGAAYLKEGDRVEVIQS